MREYEEGYPVDANDRYYQGEYPDPDRRNSSNFGFASVKRDAVPGGNKAREDATDYLNERLKVMPYESTEVLFEQRVEFSFLEGMMGNEIAFPEPLEPGKPYRVTYNGVAYDCIANILEDGRYLGNGSFAGLDDTGEPFFIMVVEGGIGVYGSIVSINSDTSATIKIEKSVIHTIDPKFLPGGGGGSGDMVVAIDVATMTPSRTYDEIVSALRSGCNARIQCNLPTNDGTGNVYAMIAPCMGEGRDCVNFISFYHNNDQAASLLTFVLSKDNTITAREGTVLFADGINNA